MESINRLTHRWATGQNIFCNYKNEIDSTNTWAKNNFSYKPSALFLADEQTQGRGRNQNTWTQAFSGGTLLSTWCFLLEHTPQPLISMRVGLALYKAYVHAWPTMDWALKAPNDIYLNGAKQSGILIEAEQEGSQTKLFIGIGANIYGTPKNVGQATSCLSPNPDTLTSGDWFKFCFFLWQNFMQIQKDPQRQNLTGEEQMQILAALQKFPNNTVAEVKSEGSLILKDQTTIHWQDL